MARKTNKTAHVLNLLSGNTSQKSNKPDETTEVQEEKTPAVSTVKMDSTDKEDPVSDIIHQKLLTELSDLIEEDTPEPVTFNPELTIEKEEPPTPISELTITDEEEEEDNKEITKEEEASTPPATLAEEKEPDAVSLTSEPVVEELPPEKEPDFVLVNLMEEIVKDKIIYYMRQFEVCTCDRCIADTIALTLNGLQPKYMVTSPAAIPPLVSFYTNKYISDITVEATKACQVIKEHPRH